MPDANVKVIAHFLKGNFKLAPPALTLSQSCFVSCHLYYKQSSSIHRDKDVCRDKARETVGKRKQWRKLVCLKPRRKNFKSHILRCGKIPQILLELSSNIILLTLILREFQSRMADPSMCFINGCAI